MERRARKFHGKGGWGWKRLSLKNTVGYPFPWLYAFADPTNSFSTGKYWETKFQEVSKSKTCICCALATIYIYLHCIYHVLTFYSVRIKFSSVAQSCPTLCNPMDCSTPGFPVHHQLPELTQTHVHRVGDAIQSSHPLLSPSPPAFNLSQHQGLFKWVCSSHQVAKVLGFQLQHQSSQEYSGLISLGLTGWILLLFKRL